jgi:hypothetical protein
VAALRAGDDRDAGLLRFFHEREALADARGIDRHRLLAEDVLLRLHRGFEVQRAEARRGGEDHEIDAGGLHLLVRVEAVEHGFRRGLDASAVLLVLLPVVEAVLRLPFEHVAERDDLDGLVRVEDVANRAVAAPAAPDHADLDGVPARGVDAGRERGGGHARGGRGLDEVAAVRTGRRHLGTPGRKEAGKKSLSADCADDTD